MSSKRMYAVVPLPICLVLLLVHAVRPSPLHTCMSMKTLQKRMPEWVGRVPYSHSVNKTWGYPTDCSGFVSWALEVGQDLKAYEYGANKYSTRIETDDLQYGDIITHVTDFSWDPRHRCGKKDIDFYQGGATGATNGNDKKEGDFGLNGNPLDYLPGHVMFFDKWADEKHENYWAYESTSTNCKVKECFNQHVMYKRKKIDKWSKENCTSSEYGFVEGGARRLSSSLLCNSNDEGAMVETHNPAPSHKVPATDSISVCNVIGKHLPSDCSCTPYVGRPEAQLNCTVNVLNLDTVELIVTIAPCGDPAYLKIRVLETKEGIDHTFHPITATLQKELPIPYLSIDIPEVGNAGLDCAVALGGDLERLEIKLGIDACIDVGSHKKCGSEITKHLPIWLLDHEFDFGSLCASH